MISAAGAVFGQHSVYLTAEEFENQLGTNNYTETFDSIAGGNLGVNSLEFSGGGPDFTFTASVPAGEGNLGGMQGANMEDHGWVGAGMRARDDQVPLNITFAEPMVSVGGYFFSALSGGAFSPNDSVRLTFSFQSSGELVQTLSASTHAGSFLGVTATGGDRITGLTIEALDVDGHSATSEITMGTIPEPGSVALGISLAALGVVVAGRRLRGRKV